MAFFTIRGLVEGQEHEFVLTVEEKDLMATYNGAVAAGMRPISIVPNFEPEGPAHSIYECGGYTFSVCGYGDCLIVTHTSSGEFVADSFETLATILDKAGYGRKG